MHGLRFPHITHTGCAMLFTDDLLDDISDRVRFGWDDLDSWFEEDEEVCVHPRDPYARVNALRSTRAVRIELNGAILAESSTPPVVFETGLPDALLPQPNGRYPGLPDPHRYGHVLSL